MSAVTWVVRWKYQNIQEGVSVVEATSPYEALVAAVKEHRGGGGGEADGYLSLGARFTVYRVGAW